MGKSKAVVLLVCELIAIVNAAYVPNPDPSEYIPNLPQAVCPEGCLCDTSWNTAECRLSINDYKLESLLPWRLQSLTIQGDEVALKKAHQFSTLKSILKGHNSDINQLSVVDFRKFFFHVKYLKINYLPLTSVKKTDLSDFSSLSTLSLAFNNISEIEPGSFDSLKKLEVLDLNGNHIGQLDDNLFSGISQLTTLYLESNGLRYISNLAFNGLNNIKRLYLKNNNIESLESFIGSLAQLDILNLERNKVTYILNSSVEVLKEIGEVKLGSNPFECSCVVKPFAEAINLINSSVSPTNLICASPKELEGRSLVKLDMSTVPCYSPAVIAISEPMDIQYQSTVTFTCQANGTSPLGVYWLTPWGETFASPHVQRSFPDILAAAKSSEYMQGINVPMKSKVYVTPDNCLHLENFRGMFRGTYTCVAVGFTGMANSSVNMDMHTNVDEVYIASIYIGVYCTVSMLTLAIVIGSVRWFVYLCMHSEGCRCCCCRSDDVSIEDKSDKSEPIEVTYEPSLTVCTADDSDDHDFDTLPPCPPVNSPQERMSPDKCQTPSESIDPSKVSPHIWEQLDEVRARLRYGAERKMEKVRSHVRSITDTGSLKIRNIKDAGTMKIQSIKETGSHAASRVRKNVASGMEQVKYGVQSIKEFCGTGEMGTGTVSMVSVSTDLDTKEQVKIVKSHTFV